ncbi:MAG: TlyA family RNA methyltransferase [Phycisphaerales bacterium]
MTPADAAPDPQNPYVSRGGLKLAHALDAFALEVAGFVCADLGCSTGGFTDCLLQRGAARVFAVDTAYGQLAWKLRNDERVTVMERSNALHTDPPEPVDLVVIDLGWTRQDKAIPAALRWTKPGGRVLSLVKPHYEADKSQLGAGGVLDPDDARRLAEAVRDELPALGVEVLGWAKSPVLGGAAGKRRKRGAGNPEWLALLRRFSER